VADAVPFDNLTDRYLAYDLDKPESALQKLTDMLIATLASDKTDSPIFNMLPTLPEVDPASVQVLPRDLAEEVERAKAAKVPGWLRLLSQEVETRRFQWPALRVIGQAQWDIEDYEGARRTYQKLIDHDSDDLDANNALANLYERQYRREKRAELLAASEQAIKRVLANNRATQERRTEALSLAGRNARRPGGGKPSRPCRNWPSAGKRPPTDSSLTRTTVIGAYSTITGPASPPCRCAPSRRVWRTRSPGNGPSTTSERPEIKGTSCCSHSTN
jgi:tetratricopeptide (TPR) repeat protein